MYRDFRPRKLRSAFVSVFCSLIWFHQGIAEHNLKAAEKQAFFVTLRRLAGSHGRLPHSMVITKEVQVEDIPLASGGFTDFRHGIYMGHLVAVKTLRVEEQHAFLKTKKVNITGIVSANWRTG
jgi:hypothetical protein